MYYFPFYAITSMSSLHAELQKFPGVWATTDDVSIMACLAQCADSLGVFAFDAKTGSSFKQEYDESDLYKIRSRIGESIKWSKFFEAIIRAMQLNKVTVKAIKWTDSNYPGNGYVGSSHTTRVAVPLALRGGNPLNTMSGANTAEVEELSLVCHSGAVGRSIIFAVRRTTDDVQMFILQQLLQRQRLYARPREFEKELKKLKQEEQQLRTQSENLEREALSLKENIARKKQQETHSSKRLADLKGSVVTEENGTENPWTTVLMKQKAQMKSRLINPLRDISCKKYDLTILRLIKSYWIEYEHTDLSAPYNRVIRPYTRAELAKKMQSFAQHPTRETVWNAMSKLDDWDYNVFELQRSLTGDDFSSLSNRSVAGSLFITFYGLMCRYKLLEKFNIDEQIALNWISMVEAGYHANPYHNFMHAADVLHITHFILSKGGLIKRCDLNSEHIFAALFAAAVHDFDHPGINNNFHIKTGSHLATLYNDRSVLENLHVSSVFELMKNSSYNILSVLSPDQWTSMREVIVEMVLATDMGMHGKYLTKLKERLQDRATFRNREDQLLALRMALKLADVSNCGRPLKIYLPWSAKVSDEFYLQGDREQNVGLPFSPFMDRQQGSIANGQIAFINYIIIPFFTQMAELLPDMSFAVALSEGNRAYWLEHESS